MITRSLQSAMLAVFALLSFVGLSQAQSTEAQYIAYLNNQGQTVYLENNRQPALYTGNFGDCLGNSAINVTRFDAAYYADNMTVLFHLAGDTALANENVMMYIGVFAYGESRFDLTFDPCNANIESLCPMNSSVPISANGIIPISLNDVGSFPNIAFSIPDFEGEAILRIFANSTESEIGCYSATVTNGNTFSQPESVGTVLGIFTIVALIASFATAIYGQSVLTMRLHYAHSLSVGVVFAVFQHIFFTGALSMNWPSVLVAWWSNFAWAGGMIYSRSMQESINHLIGNNVGNTSEVGAAAAGSTQANLGGGYDLSQIYKRSLIRDLSHIRSRDIAGEIYTKDYSEWLGRDVLARGLKQSLQRRDLANASTGYRWYGSPVGPGLPLPGNYSGFAGTLAQEDIRVSNAFMTGFLWLLILIVILVAATMAFKWILEGLIRVKALRNDRLAFFRQHWLGYSAIVALRTCFLAFFMIMLLAMFQFTYQSSGGVKGVAAIIFILFLVGITGAAAYACYYKIKVAGYESQPERFQRERRRLLRVIPWIGAKKTNQETQQQQSESKANQVPFWKRMSVHSFASDPNTHRNIHDDEDYTTKFGWLSARFRRTRWWFFAAWILYDFIRAAFFGGASGHPLTQVFGLLIVETLAFAAIVWARPFEGRRLNIIVVYCLGFSKITSVALSAAFDVRFNLPRITTTAIGIVIIVIQGLLTVITLVAIVVGAISSYMSVSRNQEDFRPRKWTGLRERYFNHLDRALNDMPTPPPPPPAEPEEPKDPYFNVSGVRRVGKIEDEDEDYVAEMALQDQNHIRSYISLNERSPPPQDRLNTASQMLGDDRPVRRGRAPSVHSLSQTSLPFGARPHRRSWSYRDFIDNYTDGARDGNLTSVDLSTRDAIGNVPAPIMRPRSGSANSKGPSRGGTPIFGTSVAGRSTEGPSRGGTPIFGTSVAGRSTEALDNTRHAPGDSSQRSSRLSNVAGESSQRGSRVTPLTPAQETEEWLPSA